MTRTYALRRLLEHGALSRREVREITRWPDAKVGRLLFDLCQSGTIQRIGGAPPRYILKTEAS